MSFTVVTKRDPATRTIPFTMVIDKDRDGAVRVNTGVAHFSMSPKSIPDVIAALQKVAGIVPPASPKRRPHGPQEYKGAGKHEWERVSPEGSIYESTFRLRVPGGWLYGLEGSDKTTFVPMPDTVGYGI